MACIALGRRRARDIARHPVHFTAPICMCSRLIFVSLVKKGITGFFCGTYPMHGIGIRPGISKAWGCKFFMVCSITQSDIPMYPVLGHRMIRSRTRKTSRRQSAVSFRAVLYRIRRGRRHSLRRGAYMRPRRLLRTPGYQRRWRGPCNVVSLGASCRKSPTMMMMLSELMVSI